MKIYIPSIFPQTLIDKLDKLTKSYGESCKINKCEIVSKDHGIFIIENETINQIESTFNSSIELIKGYNGIDLLVDKTKHTKTMVVSQLPSTYISSTYTEYVFKYDKKSLLSLVIECFEETTYATGIECIIPFNFYFIYNSENIDLNDQFFQNEFNTFLSCMSIL
jgi:hypothetical protein